METMTIGRLARAAGVGVETIRYYERKGLIPEPPRTYSGYRKYPEEAVTRLRFIRRAKDLGFTLREIGELLELRADESTTCDVVRARAAAKVADIEERIRSLEAMKTALERLAAECPASGPAKECPILDALGGGL
ncbi:MAG TPA: MerR family transcriptional regulator [Acidobacteria bacterium]|nr:MerR family transcriptional regulator [Acidobacteriota bacterium]